LINLIVEIKIKPKILSFNQEGKKIMFKKDKVDHEIPNPPTIEGTNKTIFPKTLCCIMQQIVNVGSGLSNSSNCRGPLSLKKRSGQKAQLGRLLYLKPRQPKIENTPSIKFVLNYLLHYAGLVKLQFQISL
jgi:hypothetical protein